jgi:hypothetical protein
MLKCKQVFLQKRIVLAALRALALRAPSPCASYLIFLTHGKRSKFFSSLNEAAAVQSLKIFGFEKLCFK